MEEEKDFLGKEPIGKLLLRLALPTIAAQIINMIVQYCRQDLYWTYSGKRSSCADWCRRMYAADYDRVCICSACGKWRSSKGFDSNGERKK